jgi:predicted transcriptional regulator
MSETKYSADAPAVSRVSLEIGQVVQLDPGTVRNRMFAGCFMTVTEPKSWGAQGYVQALGANEKPGGQAYYRATWEEMTPAIGVAVFVAA